MTILRGSWESWRTNSNYDGVSIMVDDGVT